MVDVEGDELYVRSVDLDSLASARASSTVRLLGGFDQWVLGPGTDDAHVIPAAHRRAVSRQSGWIAPVVVIGGVVAGTWESKGGQIAIEWFADARKPPASAVREEIARLSAVVFG